MDDESIIINFIIVAALGFFTLVTIQDYWKHVETMKRIELRIEDEASNTEK